MCMSCVYLDVVQYIAHSLLQTDDKEDNKDTGDHSVFWGCDCPRGCQTRGT